MEITTQSAEEFAELLAKYKIIPPHKKPKKAKNIYEALYELKKHLGKSCKTLRNVWYMSACNGILTGHEAKQP